MVAAGMEEAKILIPNMVENYHLRIDTKRLILANYSYRCMHALKIL